jgi:putative oxidoreductase
MSLQSIVRRVTRWDVLVTGALAFLPPLLTRLVMGQAFFLTGRGKLANFANTVEFFTNLGIPLPELNAAFVSRLEFYGGIALMLGLFTRLVAAGLASTMVVALATADKQSFLDALRMSGDQGLTDVVPFVYLMFLGWLVITGPGALSVDALLTRLLRAARSEPSTTRASDAQAVGA